MLRLPRTNGFRRNSEPSVWFDFYTEHHPSMFSDEEYTKVYQVSGADWPRISHLVGLKPTDWNYKKIDVQSATAARNLHSIPVRVVTNANYHGAEMTTLGEALKDIEVSMLRLPRANGFRRNPRDPSLSDMKPIATSTDWSVGAWESGAPAITVTWYCSKQAYDLLSFYAGDPSKPYGLNWNLIEKYPDLHNIPIIGATDGYVIYTKAPLGERLLRSK